MAKADLSKIKLSSHFLKMNKKEFVAELKKPVHKSHGLNSSDIEVLYKKLHGHDKGNEGAAEEAEK